MCLVQAPFSSGALTRQDGSRLTHHEEGAFQGLHRVCQGRTQRPPFLWCPGLSCSQQSSLAASRMPSFVASLALNAATNEPSNCPELTAE